VHRPAHEFQAEPLGTPVLPADSDALPHEAIADLMEELKVPILVVR
jgi:hypothetical protein